LALGLQRFPTFAQAFFGTKGAAKLAWSILHAFIKKSQQTPDHDLKIARKRQKAVQLDYKPVSHTHSDFLARAKQRKSFEAAYAGLELEYALAKQMLKARSKAGLIQDAVAERMGTMKSAISRLEGVGKQASALAILKKIRFGSRV